MLRNYLKSWPLYWLPHHAISGIVYRLTRIRSPLAIPFIRWFVRFYKVNLEEAVYTQPEQYPSFNTFFIRALKPEARPVDQDIDSIVSPVDGRISAIGKIDKNRIFQAKGHTYDLIDLVAGEQNAQPYRNGYYATLYLSPRDYHRIHMPVDGTLRHMTHIPGRLFSVAPHTVATIPGLFARNERVAAHFETQIGPMAIIMVGAINVAAIETVWAGLITPPAGRKITESSYPRPGGDEVRLLRGEELGRFNMGSTVIVLFGPDSVFWLEKLTVDQPIRMGQKLAAKDSCPVPVEAHHTG